MNPIDKYLCDEESKFIYENRVKYTQTGDRRFIEEMVDRTVRSRQEWRTFCQSLQRKASAHETVMFGAGIWGGVLYEETRSFVPWKCVTDSDPHRKIRGLESICFDDFIRTYTNQTIVISSYKNYPEMREQLLKHGVPEENIVNAGEAVYRATEYAIYFDLPALVPQQHEVFADAGAFDGLTTKRFLEWCRGGGFSYCFEPDPANRERIRRNLPAQAAYEIVPCALWSERGFVPMEMKGSFASAVRVGTEQETAQRVETVALDEFTGGKEVTFIKMDIEGAEAAALRGAKDTIENGHPKLAVSIYHKPEDIYQLPEIILSYYPHYKLYLRHYSFSHYDTVLYAIP